MIWSHGLWQGQGRSPRRHGRKQGRASPQGTPHRLCQLGKCPTQHNEAGGLTTRSTGAPRCQLGSTRRAICNCPALYTRHDVSPRIKYAVAIV